MTDCCAQEDGSNERIGKTLRPASATGFGQDEALAFWRGMRDGPETLQVSLLASWVEDLFGIKPRPPIDDPRLESIRRLTVALRHGLGRRAEIELEAARASGVGEQQIAAIRRRLRTPRPADREAA